MVTPTTSASALTTPPLSLLHTSTTLNFILTATSLLNNSQVTRAAFLHLKKMFLCLFPSFTLLCCWNLDPCVHHTHPDLTIATASSMVLYLKPSTNSSVFKSPIQAMNLGWQSFFSVVATSLWNSLPKHIWDCTDLKFKSLIKSHLFRTAFNHWCFYFINNNDKRWRNKQNLCFREIILQTKMSLVLHPYDTNYLL